MTLKLRTTLALSLSLLVLLVAALTASGSPPQPSSGAEDGGGVAAMCVEDVPDCDDTFVAPDGDGSSTPGWDGDGTPPSGPVEPGEPPSTGYGDDLPCGVEVVEGEGPDATVSIEPCDEPTEPVPFEPSIVEPTPGMSNVYSRPFDTATVSGDGLTVTIDFVSGIEPCYVLDHVEVVYGDDTVAITLFEGSDVSEGDVACIDIGVFKRTVVQLDQPLGDRVIVDGAAVKG